MIDVEPRNVSVSGQSVKVVGRDKNSGPREIDGSRKNKKGSMRR